MLEFYANINYRAIVKGILSYFPFLFSVIKKNKLKKGTGGSVSAEYCYDVWFRHLVLLFKSGLEKMPECIAEFGPGDSLGIGLMALLTGVKKYYAFDVIKYSSAEFNTLILNRLIELLSRKSPLTAKEKFPDLKPDLENYDYPQFLEYAKILTPRLDRDYVSKVRHSLLECEINEGSEPLISYKVPWNREDIMSLGSVDLIYSQAVMEHLVDLGSVYKTMFRWLKNGGYLSHQIDFSAHETHRLWNGHLRYNKLMWNVILHGRSYPISRIAPSVHLHFLREAGFKIIKVVPVFDDNTLKIKKYGNCQAKISKEDFTIRSAHLIARKEV